MSATTAPRMRTLPQAARMLEELDPGTAFTLTALRRMVKRGELQAFEAASKRLVNFDALLAQLANPGACTPTAPTPGTIRPIDFTRR